MLTRSTGDPHATAPRLFVAAPLHEGAELPASPEHAHYLGGVLRRVSGDVVRLFNGADGEFLATLRFARRDRLTLTVQRQLRPQTPESGPWLLFALLKRDATDLVVRQAVELGAGRIRPVLTERTIAGRVNEARLRAIAIEAAEQSERLTVPAIDPPARLDTVLAAWPTGRPLFAAIERTPAPPLASPMDAAPGPAALLIGPEGGFTPAEQSWLRRHDAVTPISLGPFVLRAETAAAAGQALLLAMGWAEYVAPDPKRPPESPSTPCPTQ
jgi:16S rRNA (uracil1498-N3)-methyltransferase